MAGASPNLGAEKRQQRVVVRVPEFQSENPDTSIGFNIFRRPRKSILPYTVRDPS
jgi:hypothetical protein